MRRWRITWRGNCPTLTLAMLGTLRQKLITDLGFTAVGGGHTASASTYRVALAAFEEGLFACHWKDPVLTIECFYVKDIAVDVLHEFIRANLPWDGVLISNRDDMGEES